MPTGPAGACARITNARERKDCGDGPLLPSTRGDPRLCFLLMPKMTKPEIVCFILALFGAIALFAGASEPVIAQATNTLEIVITGGPHAGTHKPPVSDVICVHVKQHQFSVGFKNFDAPAPNKISEAGINIDNPDAAVAKTGEVRVSFGDPKKSPTVYDLFVPRDSKGPLTFVKTGKGADLSFAGQTKDGIQLRLTARCLDIDEF